MKLQHEYWLMVEAGMSELVQGRTPSGRPGETASTAMIGGKFEHIIRISLEPRELADSQPRSSTFVPHM